VALNIINLNQAMKYLLLFSIYQFLAELQICIIYTCQHRYTDWSWQIIKWKQKIPFVGTTVPKYNCKRGKINTHFYMATHFPGLVLTLIYGHSLSWLGTHLYMATHFPGLVLTLLYGHSLSWLGTDTSIKRYWVRLVWDAQISLKWNDAVIEMFSTCE
jgi:hypothetical protein